MLCCLQTATEGGTMKTISVRLPEPTYKLLQERAKETGIPPAVLCRAWIRLGVSNEPQPFQRETLERLGHWSERRGDA